MHTQWCCRINTTKVLCITDWFSTLWAFNALNKHNRDTHKNNNFKVKVMEILDVEEKLTEKSKEDKT